MMDDRLGVSGGDQANLGRDEGRNNGESGSFRRGHWERNKPLGVDVGPKISASR